MDIILTILVFLIELCVLYYNIWIIAEIINNIDYYSIYEMIILTLVTIAIDTLATLAFVMIITLL